MACRSALVLLLALAAAPALAVDNLAADGLAGRARAIDGDTIEIRSTRVRLFGIDAPEGGQACRDESGRGWSCGRDSAAALAGLVSGRDVSCRRRDTDRFGRVVAVCVAAGQDLGRRMVLDGWAVAFRRYSRDYVADEDRARSAGRGLWRGTFDMPWDWRRERPRRNPRG
jgi:endonuclease YncB( thermonuclease family)